MTMESATDARNVIARGPLERVAADGTGLP
jgi:hypothetical protein